MNILACWISKFPIKSTEHDNSLCYFDRVYVDKKHLLIVSKKIKSSISILNEFDSIISRL